MSFNASIKTEVLKQIRALLLSSPVGLTLGELKKDYETFIGTPLPFRKLGYNTAEDFVKDIPETISISWKNGMLVLQTPSDSTTKHIERLVARQNIPKPKKYAVLRNRTGSSNSRNWRSKHQPSVPLFIRNQINQLFASYPDGLPLTHFDIAFSRRFGVALDSCRLGFTSTQDLLGSVTDIVKLDQCGREWRVIPAFVDRERYRHNSNYQAAPSYKHSESRTHYFEKERRVSDESSKSAHDVSCPPSPNSSIEPDANFDDVAIDSIIQDNIAQLLKSRPEGIWANQLSNEYKQNVGKELQFKEQGFLSIIEFVSALPHIVKIERPVPKGDWWLTHVDHKKTAEPIKTKAAPVESSEYFGSPPTIETELRESIRQVLQAHPDGVLMKDFPDVFLVMTGISLEEMSTKFKTLERLLLSVTDDVLQVQYKGEGRLMLYAIETKDSRKFDRLLEKYRPHLSPEEIFPRTAGIPEDSVGPGAAYVSVDLPSLTDYTEIYVSNICSPSMFWIQLRGAQTTLALESLMDSLERYKFADGEKYRMPESLIAIGQACAVLFPEDNNWHRGIITGIRDIDLVEVFYVDYGNTCSVHKNTLRLLRSRYFRLPVQAIQSRLANISPLGGTWTSQAKQRMLDLCRCKPLIALVTGIKDRVLSICLTDTTSDMDVHINDLLVHEKYAIFSPDHLQKADSNTIPDLHSTNLNDQSKQSIQSTSQPPESGNQRFVRACEMTSEVTLHIVSLQSELYILSAEISALFWQADILRSMLQRVCKTMNRKKVTVSKDDYPSLFTELISYGVKCVEDKTFLTLYPLDALPSILSVFQHSSSELKESIDAALQALSPEDSYWKGVDSESDSCSELSREFEDPLLGLDELRLTLQALQFKRKRIIQSLMGENVSHVDSVNQINEVEMQITKTKELIDELEAMEKDLANDSQSVDLEQDSNTSEEKVQKSITNARSPIKTNVVAPMIVNPVPSTKPADHNNPSLSSLQAANQDLATMMQQQQLLQSVASSQSGTGVWDPSMMGVMSGFSMLFPMMQTPAMITQMSSMGRGQPAVAADMTSMPALQNIPSMPGMSNMPNVAYVPQFPNIPNLSNLPGLQNLMNMTPVTVPQNTSANNSADVPGMSMGQGADNPMLLPGLLPLLQNLQLGRGRGGPSSGNGGQS
ncbi:tudor domain-containing protein 5-like [Gigantopelta aegis]|uniref:tudor domain-containing protein 5-like n=1 Tax=Gigantopelta aegis TaxID=1735272 RepID=UPI001B889687|nr:tudor domain-containing protein 5-like [Gigantopelta aegis]